jgi:hypothetical protein
MVGRLGNAPRKGGRDRPETIRQTLFPVVILSPTSSVVARRLGRFFSTRTADKR